MQSILVVDGSELMAWLVGNLVPAGVEVRHASSFAEAESILRNDTPQAAVFNITPSELNWRLLHELCHAQDPPMPHIWCATIDPDEGTDDALPCDRSKLIGKPFHIDELRSQINELFGDMERSAATPSPDTSDFSDPTLAKPLT